MDIAQIKPGQRFYFQGDWQTDPGVWEVIEHGRDLPSMTACAPVSRPSEGVSNFFSRGVSVSAVPASD